MRTQQRTAKKKGLLDQSWVTFLLLFFLLILIAIFVIALKKPELLTDLLRRKPKAPTPPKLLVPPIIISAILTRKLEQIQSRKSSFHPIILLSLPLLISPLSSCGYVTTSEYLSHINTINIPMAANRTVEYGLDEEVTKSIADRFRRRWGEGNDLIFSITITDFKPEPISFDANNFPERYSYIIKLDYTLEDRVEGKIIAERKDYIQRHNFYVVQGRGEEPETERVARGKLLEELADQLYSDLAEQW